MKTIIFGYPGTGKTQTLIDITEDLFSKGFNPLDICFCTYTKAGAMVMKSRTTKKFNLQKEDMTYFGTIHSLCFKRFCEGKDLIKQGHLSNFFRVCNLEYREMDSDEDLIVKETFGDEDGNKLINFYNLLRMTSCKTIFEIKDVQELKKLFHENKITQENFIPIFSNVFDPHAILVAYEGYKKENNLIDFVDMLIIAYKEKWVIPTKILFLDEAQDLSPLQWAIYDLWCQNKEEIYVAGDDDQSIYSFQGADPKRLIKEKESANEVRILKQTWRIPKTINYYCLNYIDNNIDSKNRIRKEVIAVREGGELIEENIGQDLEKTLDYLRENKTAFILFRTNNQKKQFISEVLQERGFVYGEIRGQSIWNMKSISIYNAIMKLSLGKNIDPIETSHLINSLVSKFKLLKRGLKSNFKDMVKKESYSITDLIELGFDMNIFNYLKDFKILTVLNISDSLKGAILALPRPNKLIEWPLKLNLGTIHSSKGMEADDVILFKDISKKMAKEITKDKDSWENEIRLFHVGQTRARERLIILRGGFDYCESDLIP